MNFGTLITNLLNDTVAVSLPLFRPELALAATIVLLLLCRILPVLRHLDSALVALGGVGFALWYAWCDLRGLPVGDLAAGRQELFTGLIVFDSLTAYVLVDNHAMVALLESLPLQWEIGHDRELGASVLSMRASLER